MTRVIVIGGTSHVGKSTLANALADTFGRTFISTDRLGRHPGRPWPAVRAHVAEYYSKLTAEAIYSFLLDHHENMWPGLRTLIEGYLQQDELVPAVFEGCALRPEYVTELTAHDLRAVWLTADHDLIRERIYSASSFHECSKESRYLIERFVERSLTDNDRILAAAVRLGLRTIDVGQPHAVKNFEAELLDG